MSHYDTLGVPKDASADQIKDAYRRLARRYHPDMNPGEASAGAEAMFKEVKRAYEVLSDDAARKRYDETGTAEAPPTPREEARGLLLQMFQAALEHDGDVKRTVQNCLVGMKSEINAKRAEFQRRLKRLNKRSGKIKVKQGENLAQMLIDQQIAQLTKDIATMDHGLAINREAFVMLDNYENEEVEQAPPSPMYHALASGVFGTRTF